MDDIEGIEVINYVAANEGVPAYIHDADNPFEFYSDAAFYQHFRLTKNAAIQVINEVAVHLPLRSADSRTDPAYLKLLYTMQYIQARS